MADPLQEISLENAGGAACDVFELSQVSQHPGQCHQSPTKLVLAEQSGYQKHHPNVIAAATAIRQPASTSIRIVLFGMRPPSSAWDIFLLGCFVGTNSGSHNGRYVTLRCLFCVYLYEPYSSQRASSTEMSTFGFAPISPSFDSRYLHSTKAFSCAVSTATSESVSPL